MKYYKVDIDEEVWNFVKNQAEPLTDTVNSVLRRLLLGAPPLEEEKSAFSYKIETKIDLPRNIPRALAQILEVIYEIQVGKRSRQEATRVVAMKNGTAPQTIIDKYCRQLGKTAREVDNMLEDTDLIALKDLLSTKFPKFVDLIQKTLPFYSRTRSKDNVTKREPQVRQRSDRLLLNKLYSFEELRNIELGKDSRPSILEIQGRQIDVSDWTELCVRFVESLIAGGILVKSKTPVFNHAEKDKYFISLKPKHLSAEKDAEWKQVGDYFVDTKYNASAHVKNLESALHHLNAINMRIRIGFRN
jgi:hypothetical protein